MKLSPDALLFDMDGVLIDSVDTWLTALNKALKNNQYRLIPKDEFIQSYWGHDLRDTFTMMDIPLTIVDQCSKIYENSIQKIRLYPSTIPTLQQLSGYPKAIITNTALQITEKIVQQFHLELYFSQITTGDEVRKAKPHPEIILRTCEKLNIKAKNALLIGDTKSDVIAGHAAGCTVIGVNIEADYVISDLSELPSLLQ